MQDDGKRKCPICGRWVFIVGDENNSVFAYHLRNPESEESGDCPGIGTPFFESADILGEDAPHWMLVLSEEGKGDFY